MTTIKKDIFIERFAQSVDDTKEYSLPQYLKIVDAIFKNVKSKEPNVPKVPKPPSEYILFVQNAMKDLKVKNPGAKSNDLIKLAAIEWGIHKKNKADAAGTAAAAVTTPREITQALTA